MTNKHLKKAWHVCMRFGSICGVWHPLRILEIFLTGEWGRLDRNKWAPP